MRLSSEQAPGQNLRTLVTSHCARRGWTEVPKSMLRCPNLWGRDGVAEPRKNRLHWRRCLQSCPQTVPYLQVKAPDTGASALRSTVPPPPHAPHGNHTRLKQLGHGMAQDHN